MSAPEHSRSLSVFARNPIAGQVKTRLAQTLGAETATAIYRRLLSDTLAVATQTKTEGTLVWLANEQPNQEMCALLSKYHLDWHKQHGTGLGDRMQYALTQAHGAFQQAIVIGTDCPELSTEYLDAAFNALRHSDVVIGPAADGGYVLIGTRNTCPDLFSNIPWSTEHVLSTTRKRLSELNLKWQELDTLRDIDTAADLDHLPWVSELS